MKASIKKNYIYNVLYQLLTILTPLITTPYVSRILGAGGIGQYELTQATVQYFILAGTIGLNMYGQREIAYVQDSKKQRSIIFWELTVLRAVTMAISILCYMAFIPFSGKYRILYWIQLLDLIANLIDIAWFFQGLEEFRLTVMRNVIVRLAGVICVFLFIRKADDVPLYVLAHSLPLLLASVSMWGYLKRYVEKPRWEELKQIRRHLKPALALFIPQVAAQIYLVLDKTMIGLITHSDAEVGYYGNAQKIIKLLLAVVTSLCTVMLPRMSFAYAQKEFDKMKEYMWQSFSFAYFLAVPMMFGIIGVAENFVPVFFGEGFDKVAPLMQMMSPIIIWIAFSNIIGYQYLLPTRRQTQYTISITVGAVVNFVLNLILISLFESIGAVIATAFAEFAVMAVQLYVVRKEFSLAALVRGAWKFVLSGGVMLFFVLVIGRQFHGIKGLVIQVCVGIGSYVIMLLALREQTVFQVLRSVEKKVCKR